MTDPPNMDLHREFSRVVTRDAERLSVYVGLDLAELDDDSVVNVLVDVIGRNGPGRGGLAVRIRPTRWAEAVASRLLHLLEQSNPGDFPEHHRLGKYIHIIAQNFEFSPYADPRSSVVNRQPDRGPAAEMTDTSDGHSPPNPLSLDRPENESQRAD